MSDGGLALKLEFRQFYRAQRDELDGLSGLTGSEGAGCSLAVRARASAAATRSRATSRTTRGLHARESGSIGAAELV